MNLISENDFNEIVNRLACKYNTMTSDTSVKSVKNKNRLIKLLTAIYFMDKNTKMSLLEKNIRVMVGNEDIAPILFTVLSDLNFFPLYELNNYGKLGSYLQTETDVRKVPGLDAPCVTNSKILALASSYAHIKEKSGESVRIFVLIGESSDYLAINSECQRIAKMKLKNVICIFVAYREKDKQIYQEKIYPLLKNIEWKLYNLNVDIYESLITMHKTINKTEQPVMIFTDFSK